MLDELAHAGPEHLDLEFVAGYDRKQGYPDPAGDLELLRRYGVGERSTVIDFGAGTGRFALAAARRFGYVVAADVSPVMLENVRTRAAEAGVTNLRCVKAGFLSYENDGQPADAVHTRNALHHLPDFWKAIALSRIAGMLRPGGIMLLHDLIYSFPPDEAEKVFSRWFAGASDDPSAGYTAEDYAEHIRTEYSTFSWLLEPMIDAAGFDIVESDTSTRVFASYTCVRRSQPSGAVTDVATS
nr:class I SAM-dependent methyltransferase [Phytoactinopolyspora alkaliphila]